MRNEDHHLLAIAEKVQFSITSYHTAKTGVDETVLTASPSDDDFLPAIRLAGVNIEDMPMAEEPSTSNDAFSKYLSKQGGKLND